VIKSKRIRWVEHVAQTGIISVEKREGKRPLGRLG
jgi:hypothetical protein